jgi:hypothetical protein
MSYVVFPWKSFLPKSERNPLHVHAPSRAYADSFSSFSCQNRNSGTPAYETLQLHDFSAGNLSCQKWNKGSTGSRPGGGAIGIPARNSLESFLPKSEQRCPVVFTRTYVVSSGNLSCQNRNVSPCTLTAFIESFLPKSEQTHTRFLAKIGTRGLGFPKLLLLNGLQIHHSVGNS